MLEALTKVPDPGRDAWLRHFQLMQQSKPAAYYTLAILDAATDEIVAVGSLFIEYKFIRGLGACGHIEDIAVDPKTQGKGLGKKLIRALTGLSEALGTYKVILDCSEDNKRGCSLLSSLFFDPWLIHRNVRAHGSLLRKMRVQARRRPDGELEQQPFIYAENTEWTSPLRVVT